ncbi:MAG TPA: diguanylate cyclase [Rhodospirillaceae bacterium]|nr:diguanylate cyclase [Rhodospirillaceae bacterium]
MANSGDLLEMIKRSGDICAQEMIHLAGAIQPHGLLVGLDAATLALVTKSANVDTVFGATPLDKKPTWIPPSVIEACRDLEERRSPDRVLLAAIVGIGLTEVHCFIAGDVVFIEFEVVSASPAFSAATGSSPRSDDFVRQLSSAADIPGLSEAAAAAIRAISGFERVLVYRFDADGNGDVVGESLTADWTQSFLGLRFPAADIPVQARELYRMTNSRWSPTRDYQPVPLEPNLDRAGQPLDLSLSRYRSVSPVHRMYQRNIGVDGAMSVSVMNDGKLWGLVIGHHRQPHFVPETIRGEVVGLVHVFALRLDALLNREARADLERGMQSYLAMLRKLATADDFLVALTESKPDIFRLLPGCSGMALVTDSDGTTRPVRSVGNAPPGDDLIALAAWIRSAAQAPVFFTDNLSSRFPLFSRHRETASGVLACFFDDAQHTMMLVFRPEIIQSVSWAGKPEKLVGPDGKLSLPRMSFDRWAEVRRGYSQPWLAWELDIAAIICTTVNDVVIRQTQIAAELRNLSRTDPLTGLFNRRAFSETGDVEFLRCKRFGTPTAILVIDVDHFKRINDDYGHGAGDAALVALATILKASARATDVPARFGGEEFVFLLVGSDASGALEKAERIRMETAKNTVTSGRHRFGMTVSIGIAQFLKEDQDWLEAFSRADKAMYQAKSQGRNRVATEG